MDIFNVPYLYAKKYVTKAMLSNDILVFPRFDGERDDKYQNYIINYPDFVASIAADISLTSVASVTLNNFSPIFNVANTGTAINPIFTFTAIPQNANVFYAGPVSGPAANPIFRNITQADLPLLQVGNAGLSAGDLYVDTAANVLANGDLVVARKV